MRGFWSLIAVLLGIGFFGGCNTDGGGAACTGSLCGNLGGGGASPSPIPTIVGGITGQIYVTSSSGTGVGSILRFQGITTVDGNTAPDATISGATTQLNGSRSIFLDAANDRLYVANGTAGKILIFNTVSTKTGDAAPDAVIQSTSINSPEGLFVDTTANRLYVSNNAATPQISVFASASTLSGTVKIAATATVTPGVGSFSQLHGIWVDASGTLYVADSGNKAIQIFKSVTTTWTATGMTPTPDATLIGDLTLFNQPAGVAVDAGGNLVVSDAGANAVLIFAGASTLSGTVNVAPIRKILGATTTLISPQHFTLLAGSDLIVVANSAGILAFWPYSTLTGDTAPSHTITGLATGLGTVFGLALDTTR